VVAELSRLQDQVAPAPPGSVRALLEAELGRPVAEVFAELDPEPIAAASVAQAYRGRLRSGEAVVVKGQRPGIAESVDRDLLVLAELARLAEALLRCALRQMLVDGHFHADPHPGNVLVLADGRLGLIDLGAAGRLDPLQQASMREMLVAVQQRDAGLLRSAVLEVAILRRHFDDDQLERALARFMARHLAAGAAPARPCSTTCCSCSSPSGSTSRRSSRPSSGPWSPWKGP
jgi:predicted unusual protein kinase regulating ubiquinone biosynthesis (AarF/ABC1/UbiB family)